MTDSQIHLAVALTSTMPEPQEFMDESSGKLQLSRIIALIMWNASIGPVTILKGFSLNIF